MVALGPQAMGDFVNDSSGLFNSAEAVSQQYKDGVVKIPALGLNFGMTQNISMLVTGTRNTAYVIDTIPTSGDVAISVDSGAGDINAGELFTIAGVFKVNALTKVSTGVLQQFAVTADSAGGTVNLAVTPAIISTGPYQNVDTLPGAAAAITFMGSAGTAYRQNLAFHPDFAAVGFADLDIPQSAVYATRKTEDNVSIRCIQFYDGVNDVETLRMDVLFGSVVTIGRFGCRIFQP
jgi:hypothetical protein